MKVEVRLFQDRLVEQRMLLLVYKLWMSAVCSELGGEYE